MELDISPSDSQFHQGEGGKVKLDHFFVPIKTYCNQISEIKWKIR